jgi:hypothetical protein
MQFPTPLSACQGLTLSGRRKMVVQAAFGKSVL